MPIGFPGGGLFSRSGAQSGFGQLLGLGGGAPDADYDQINALLQHFGGLQIPNGYQPHGVFEDMPWMSKQAPALAHGMDNALIALANMGPTGATAGENISNVARGLQSIRPTRQAQAAAGVMLPLQMAGQLAQLQAQGSYMDYMKSMANYYNKRNDTTLEASQNRLQAGIQKNAMLSGKEGVILADGTVGLPTVDDDGKVTYQSHPEIDAKAWQKQQSRSKLQSVLGNSLEGQITMGILGDDPEKFSGQVPGSRKKYPAGSVGYHLAARDIMLADKTAPAQVGAASRSDVNDTNTWSRAQQKVYTDLLGKQPSDKDITSRAAAIVSSPGFKPKTDAPFAEARQQAEQEATEGRNRLTQAYGEFSGMGEDDQRKAGGFASYWQSKSGAKAAPQAAAPSGSSNLSPAVQAIINQLNAPK